MPTTHHFRTSRWVIVVFGFLGTTFVVLATVFAFVAKDKIWGVACVSVPMGGMGIWLLTRVPRLLRTSIVLDESGITLQIPVWAHGWLRQGRAARLNWGEIQRLTHERRVYYPMLLPTVVDEYTLHTARGDYTITKNICPKPQEIMGMIASRTGKPVEEVGERR